MLKQEFKKVVLSTKSKIVFTYLLIVALLDNIYGISQSGELGGLYNIHPTYVSLLSGQSGIICYALFVWILPIPLMLLYCDKYQAEKRFGVSNIITTKVGRKKFFFIKEISAFFISSVTCGIPLIINLLVYMFFLNGNTSFLGMEEFKAEDIGEFCCFCIHHPYVAWVGYFSVALIIFGLLGMMCQSMSFIFEDSRVSYIVCFAIWILFFCFRYNIPKIIQPYTEYGYIDALKSFAVFLPFVIIPIVFSFLRVVVSKDEI